MTLNFIAKLMIGTALLMPAQVWAQDTGEAGADQGGFDVIVVTAQKRSESVQDIPLSINSVSDEAILKSGTTNIEGVVGLVPGLNARSDGATQNVLAIRGIGTNAFGVGVDGSVGVFIDDVYAGLPVVSNASFFDVERVEVVKGPQGTLFGRNTSAGAVSVISKRAELGATYVQGRLAYGTDNQQLYELIANLEASDTAAFRIGAKYEKRDGTFVNTTTGNELNNKDNFIIRGGMTLEPAHGLIVKWIGEYVKDNSRWGVAAIDGTDRRGSAGIKTVTQGAREDQDVDVFRTALHLDYELSDSLSFTSITSYLDINSVTTPGDFDIAAINGAGDVSFTAQPDNLLLDLLPFREPGKFKFFSTELRLNGTSDRVDWFVGASFRRDKLENDTSLVGYNDFHLTPLFFDADCDVVAMDFGIPVASCNPNAEEHSPAQSIVKSFGIYGDVAFKVTDRLKLTAGGRLSIDKKRFALTVTPSTGILGQLDTAVVKPITGTGTANDKWTEFTPRVAIDYEIADAVLLYASYSRGFKSGGFNSSFDETRAILSVEPEINDAYEIGLKSELFGRNLRLNIAAFQSDYSNFQIEVQNGAAFTIRNVADAKVQGFEVEVNALLGDYFDIGVGYAYIDATAKNGTINGMDISGNSLPFAPKHSLSVVGNFTIDTGIGEFNAQASYSYTGRQFTSPLEDIANGQFIDSSNTLDLRVGLTDHDGRWGIAVLAENVTDQRYWASPNNVLDVPIGVPNYGASVKAEVSFRFP